MSKKSNCCLWRNITTSDMAYRPKQETLLGLDTEAKEDEEEKLQTGEREHVLP